MGKIEKRTKWITSFDKVQRWHCDTKKENKRIPVHFKINVMNCECYPTKVKEGVVVNVKERKCKVIKFKRDVCDNEKGGHYYQDGYGRTTTPPTSTRTKATALTATMSTATK